MKLIVGSLIALLLIAIPPHAISQNQSLNLKAGAASIEAVSIERSPGFPGIVQLKGSVQITMKIGVSDSPPRLMIMVVRADEADYHEDTGEIEARGNVQMNYRDDPDGAPKVGRVRIKLEKIESK